MIKHAPRVEKWLEKRVPACSKTALTLDKKEMLNKVQLVSMQCSGSCVPAAVDLW